MFARSYYGRSWFWPRKRRNDKFTQRFARHEEDVRLAESQMIKLRAQYLASDLAQMAAKLTQTHDERVPRSTPPIDLPPWPEENDELDE